MSLFSIITLSIFLVACAGPTSPFGSIDSFYPDARIESIKNAIMNMSDNITENPTIEFFPKRQNLHQNKNFKVRINTTDTDSPEKNIKFYYNGLDQTNKFLNVSKINYEKKYFEITVPNLHLPSNRYNDIKIEYQEPRRTTIKATYYPPSCKIYNQNLIENTEPFSPPQYFIQLIESFAPRSQINPSIIAGMVAQESGFNPNSVSWAKAIGLTQMTPLAEKQIISNFDHFPRFPNLNEFNYLHIKGLIYSGKIDKEQEWRLNPEYSIQGGIAYMKYIDDYWRATKNSHYLKKLPGEPQVVYTQVLLASYNSGPARVKHAIKRQGPRWLLDEKLIEAHKYVNRVFSYCYHFSYQEPTKEFAYAF